MPALAAKPLLLKDHSHVVRKPALPLCPFELLPAVLGGGLDGFHVNIDGDAIVTCRAEVNGFRTLRKWWLIFEKLERRPWIVEDSYCDAELVVCLIDTAKPTPAVFQDTGDRGLESR